MSAAKVLLLMIICAFLEGASLIKPSVSAGESDATLQREIAAVEASVDSDETAALASAAKVSPGAPERLAALGKVIYFDKNLSVNRNTACAFCHMPQTGFQGFIEVINKNGVNQPGSVRTRFSLRKPPSAAYAALAPPLYYRASSDDFVGGNFWDLRATGRRLRNPAASQAQGSPLNPTEMANREPACVVRRLSQARYRQLFEDVLGPLAFQLHWPADVDAVCSVPNSNPNTRIGSEVPGPNQTPYVVKLGPTDRARVTQTFDAMAVAIATFEASPDVSAFSSKFDAYLTGKAQLSAEEQRGFALFNGNGRCIKCHVDDKGDRKPLFTDQTTSNLGVPKNPAMSYYLQTKPDRYGYVGDPAGGAFIDKGVGDFLRSPEDVDPAWRPHAASFDGKVRVATVRNVDQRPSPGFVKAYGHNGYFKTLKEIVHFYNTRDTLPRCAAGSPGEKTTCWPAPEVTVNLNKTCCDLGLTDRDENDIVAFMKTLTDGWTSEAPHANASARPTR
jgi:cytochrome c peroxidase